MRDLIIHEANILKGTNLEFIKKASLRIDDGYFTRIIKSNKNESLPRLDNVYNAKNLLMIPGLVNAHTHLADSFAKDTGIGKSLNELFRPTIGLKHKLLESVSAEIIINSIRNSVMDMLKCGVTTFADFREGGKKGVEIMKKALIGLKIRSIILGRPDYYFDEEEIKKNPNLPDITLREIKEMLQICDGIGLSGANEYSEESMKELSKLKDSEMIFAVHACEDMNSMNFSLKNFNRSEVERLLENLNLDFLVHMTNAREQDMEIVSKLNIPVVCCPRANSILGLGFPPINSMLNKKIIVALGTDNVMMNAPNLFREMDYTSRVMRALEKKPSAISSKEILKMTTINAAKALKLEKEIGSIDEGKKADAVFINMNTENLVSVQDPVSAVVHRVRPDDIQAVMIGGEIVFGSLSKRA